MRKLHTQSCWDEMIETAELSLDQKSAGIKAAAAPALFRGFALWIALLLLYFLLLPSAAETAPPAAADPQALASALPATPAARGGPEPQVR